MRYVRIFSLNLQYVLAHRTRPVIYVFTYIFSSLLFLAFMRGVFESSKSLEEWTLSGITGYYFLLIPVAGALMTHPEFPILRDDIEKGELAGRLLKPFSYYWQRFFIEIPVRIFQSVIGVLAFLVLSFFFKNILSIDLSFTQLILLFVIFVLSYFMCFTLKMILAVVAFWTTDIRGIREALDTFIVIFAGYIVPVNLLPNFLERFAYLTPFPYIIYYPIIGILGDLSIAQMQSIILTQSFWLAFLAITFYIQWKKAVRKFADFGH